MLNFEPRLHLSPAGMYTYLSYRDPNLLKTVEEYDGTPSFLRSLELDNDALTKVCTTKICPSWHEEASRLDRPHNASAPTLQFLGCVLVRPSSISYEICHVV